MLELAFDWNEHAAMIEWQERGVRSTQPKNWYDVTANVSRELTGKLPARFSLPVYISGKQILLTWNPSVETIISAALGRNYAHLCWGGLGRKGFKGFFERLLLRRAGALLVNDPVTAEEIDALSGRNSIQIPYIVDSDFFEFKHLEEREDFLFSCATNDRDPDVLLALAQSGYKVVWNVDTVTRDGPIAEAHPNLILISSLNWEQLRGYYRACSAYVIPTLRDVHAAGQTTILEAISCGAPVIVSNGRTARIFDSLPSVMIAQSEDIDEWIYQLTTVAQDPEMGAKTKTTRKLVENNWSFEVCQTTLKSSLANLFDERCE